ncbi:hypothetical protein H6P81_005003 [Aristolochia fimbriata]|uniref:Annexin n=1 Tax=Aristolochia fimbriata TaxID=158543 RepID=A0AAV7ETX6_ARIFI|nr:hypothetical protein H6P81_005003 [Aristolochia fimbriata]
MYARGLQSLWEAQALDMATSASLRSISCEKTCKDIHDKWGRVDQLARVLACTTNMERRQIRETYKSMYGLDPTDHLQQTRDANANSEIGSLLSLWLLEPHERDAVMAREALNSSHTNYNALLELYIGRKSSQLLLIKQEYHAKFKRQLDQDISSEPDDSYQKILVALATSHKSHYTEVSQHVAKCDAKRLHEAGEGRMGTIDENVVLEIISKRSIQQLKITINTYKHIYGRDYRKSLKSKPGGEFEDALRMVVECLCNPVKYFSKMLNKNISETTKDNPLPRVLISRAGIDIAEIGSYFKAKYGRKLEEAIEESVTNTDQRDFLVALAAANSTR